MLWGIPRARARLRVFERQFDERKLALKHRFGGFYVFEGAEDVQVIMRMDTSLFAMIFPLIFPMVVGGSGVLSLVGGTTLTDIGLGVLLTLIGLGLIFLLSPFMLYIKVMMLQDDTLHLIEHKGIIHPSHIKLPRFALRHVVMNEVEQSSGPTNWVLVQKASDHLEIFSSSNRKDSEWVKAMITEWARRK